MVSSQMSSDDEDERTLHFERLPYDAQHILALEGGSCLAVHDKFLLVGTQRGYIHILDHQGNKTKTLTNHTTPVCHISVDYKGENMASCSENGSVYIHGTASQENNQILSFGETVHFCVLDPNFSNDSKKRFLIGTDKVLLFQKGLFTKHKSTEIYRGEGSVRTCSWRGRFAAFSTDISVIVYDVTANGILCKFKRDQDPSLPAELYPCQLAWMDDMQLLVGWADRINMCNIKEKDEQMRRSQVSPTTYYLEISSIFTTDDIFVCGLAPCDANIAILGTEKVNGTDVTSQMLFQLLEPHNKYCTQISSDRIPLKMTSKLRTDFTLSCLSSEQRFFILSPSELVVARPADRDDFIDRLISNKNYEEAMQVMVTYSSEIKRHTLLVVGRYYLNDLLETEKYAEVGPLCQKIFGSQAVLWEEQVFMLARRKLCHIIANFVPINRSKQLKPEAYEIMLNEFIQLDPEKVPQMLKKWKKLYNVPTVLRAIEERLKYAPDESLQEAVGILMVSQERYAEALRIFLSIRAAKELENLLESQFKLLKDAILQQIVAFMDIDCQEAARFFAKHEVYSVKEISSRLREHKKYRMEYLRCKFAKKPQELDEEDHEQLLEFFVLHEPQHLLAFLRKSNRFPLERALHLCEQKGLVRETAFLHERMGDHRKALVLIVENLKDVELAIQFCKEQAREDLWKDLIDLCVYKPQLLTVLLKHIGNYIEPILLLKAIPEKLEIPHLRDSLVRIIHDFRMQIALRKSCLNIIQSNRTALVHRLYNARRKPVQIGFDTVCDVCNRQIVQRDPVRFSNAIAFSCEHNYHEICLEITDQPECKMSCSNTKKTTFEYI